MGALWYEHFFRGVALDFWRKAATPEQTRYDVAESRLDIQYTFIRDGKSDMREAASHVYTVAEIRRLLSQVGLETLSLFGSLDRQPYQLGSPRLILVAQKQ